jgi:adenylosuccinate lyase
MIPRYSLPEMSRIWSEERKLEVWKEVETLVTEAWVKAGVAPPEAAQALRTAPGVDPVEWKSREAVTNHDVAAFVDVLAASVAAGGEWVHYGLTSSDMLDTAQGRILKDAAELLQQRLDALLRVVVRRAVEHRDTVMIGRTHGIWAEPTTFGLKLATWAFEVDRDRARLRAAADSVAVGKISGAVGTYAHTPPEIEAYVCDHLGVAVEPASSQITQRDRHAEFLATLALIGASLERFATEIRHLQRSEVGEVRESFGKGQKGSSAMPHKRNPIASENITGLARLLRSYASAGFENVALWHERDISHSSAERVALPDACLILDFALVRMTKLIDNLVVDEARMLRNLEATLGLVFSQAVLLAIIEEQGLARDEAYRIVQRNALRAWDEGLPLRDLLAEDLDVALHPEVLDRCFSPQHFLRHSGVIFDRLEQIEI